MQSKSSFPRRLNKPVIHQKHKMLFLFIVFFEHESYIAYTNTFKRETKVFNNLKNLFFVMFCMYSRFDKYIASKNS